VNKQFDPAVRSTVEGTPQNADAVSDVLKAGKQTEKKRIHLKYMHPSQQTVAYAQKQRHALVERKHSGQELVRLSAQDFTKVTREHGLFEDLTGKPCQKPDCSTVSSGFGAEGRVCARLTERIVCRAGSWIRYHIERLLLSVLEMSRQSGCDTW
jgi:hypothetical protein